MTNYACTIEVHRNRCSDNSPSYSRVTFLSEQVPVYASGFDSRELIGSNWLRVNGSSYERTVHALFCVFLFFFFFFFT